MSIERYKILILCDINGGKGISKESYPLKSNSILNRVYPVFYNFSL